MRGAAAERQVALAKPCHHVDPRQGHAINADSAWLGAAAASKIKGNGRHPLARFACLQGASNHQ